MADIDFTPAQEQHLRRCCGLGPADGELTSGALVAVLEALAIVDREARRWDGSGTWGSEPGR
jgi:hypothetical protein